MTDNRVTVGNVPSYRYRRAQSLHTPEFGEICGDIAWGGNWFFLVSEHGQRLEYDNVDTLTEFTRIVCRELDGQGIRGPQGELIDHVELFGPASEDSGADSRNFVLCPGGVYDRSPCGTGTSAQAGLPDRRRRNRPGRGLAAGEHYRVDFRGACYPARGANHSGVHRQRLYHRAKYALARCLGPFPLWNRLIDMKQLFPLVLVPVLLLSCAPPESREPAVPNEAAAADTIAAELHALFEDEWRSRLARDPLFASYQGVTDYNGLLPDVSPAAQERYLEEDREISRTAGRESTGKPCPRQTAQTMNCSNSSVGNRVKLAEYRAWRIPILSDDGFHMSVQRMYESAPLDTVEDYEQYLARLQATGNYFDQNIANMRQGIADGFTQPRAILEGILPSISGSIVEDPEESVFFTPFLRLARSIRRCHRRTVAGGRPPGDRRDGRSRLPAVPDLLHRRVHSRRAGNPGGVGIGKTAAPTTRN